MRLSNILLWSAIIAVALADVLATSFGIIPAVGDLFAVSSNFVTEIIEFALIIGLVANKK